MTLREVRGSRRSIGGILLAVAAAVAGCSDRGVIGLDADQGIEGLVLIGPQCPVASQQDPCPDLPYEATIQIRTFNGAPVTVVRSDAEGRFRVGLRVGRYTLVPENGNPFPIASEQSVVVVDGAYTSVTVSYDTGIR